MTETTSAAPPAPTISRQIALEAIRESPTNPRRDFGDMTELEASIRRLGVLQPVLVRPLNGAGTYELVFGHRRFRAARQAGLAEVPCLVRAMDDVEVLEAQLVENCQRHDIHPMDEAEAYEQLHKVHHHSVEDLAAKVGKSKAHVYGRLKLCDLCKSARKAFLEGKLSASTALLIARIPDAKLQDSATREITNWGPEGMSFRSASDHMQRRYMLRLAEAPFSTKAADLVPAAGPCTTCPKRTGNEKLLFADVRSADVCTDPACYARKVDATWVLKKAAAKAAGQEVLEGKAADAARRHGGAYVDLNNACYEDPKMRNYRDLLRRVKPPLPVVLARGSDGVVHELAAASAAKKALKALGVLKKASIDARPLDHDDAAWKRRQEADKAKRARVAALNAELVKRIVAKECLDNAGRPHPDAWLLIAIASCRSAGFAEELLARRGWLPEQKNADPWKILEERVRELVVGNEAFATRQLHGVMLELALAPGDYHPGKDSLIDEACRLFKIDQEQVAKELAAAEQAKPKGGKKKPGKAAATPAEPTCRKCGCTEDKACDGGCSWVEPDLCSACAEKTPPPVAAPPAKRPRKAKGAR